jgi:RNA polymerase sigma-70 factor (ECF subfamily)
MTGAYAKVDSEVLQADRELLRGCFSGDPKAWHTFVERYQRLILNAVAKTLIRYGFTHNQEQVEEIFQIVFLSLYEDNYRKLRQFQGSAKLSSWLHVVAVRKTIDFLRKTKKTVSLDDESNTGPAQDSDAYSLNANQEEALLSSEERRLFEEAKSELNERELFFMDLYYRRELPAAEIARILKTSENNVYQLNNRIKTKLKKIVEKKV